MISAAEQVSLPPIVLIQQRAIDAALSLAAVWEDEAAGLTVTAEYTRRHGTSTLADRYALRARTFAGHAKALRTALQLPPAEAKGSKQA